MKKNDGNCLREREKGERGVEKEERRRSEARKGLRERVRNIERQEEKESMHYLYVGILYTVYCTTVSK